MMCEFVKMEAMMDLFDNASEDEFNSYSQHRLTNHAFRNIDFGNTQYGIYGACHWWWMVPNVLA
ncbi:MAG: hypothetical protein ACRDL7_00980, partial [Gaiellaceae bacterium]